MRLPVSCSREHAAAESSPAAGTRAAGRAMFDSAGPPGHTPFRSSRFMASAEESEDPQVSRSRLLRLVLSEQPCSLASGLRSCMQCLRRVCMAIHMTAHKRQLQGAGDRAADDSRGETEAVSRDGGPGPRDADAAAGSDVPSSSGGGAPPLQQAVWTKQRHGALPEHARMVAELQVRCACQVLLRSGSARCRGDAGQGGCSSMQGGGVTPIGHDHHRRKVRLCASKALCACCRKWLCGSRRAGVSSSWRSYAWS